MIKVTWNNDKIINIIIKSAAQFERIQKRRREDEERRHRSAYSSVSVVVTRVGTIDKVHFVWTKSAQTLTHTLPLMPSSTEIGRACDDDDKNGGKRKIANKQVSKFGLYCGQHQQPSQ